MDSYNMYHSLFACMHIFLHCYMHFGEIGNVTFSMGLMIHENFKQSCKHVNTNKEYSVLTGDNTTPLVTIRTQTYVSS